jgi:hypothetical protein
VFPQKNKGTGHKNFSEEKINKIKQAINGVEHF